MVKLIFKSLLILLIIFLILNYSLNKIFLNNYVPFRDTIDLYKRTAKDSIDVIFFGSSHAFSTFNPEIIDKSLGTYTYNFGSADQRINVTNYLLQEILEETKPKLVILEVFLGAIKPPDSDESKGFQLNVIDNMPFSLKKVILANEIYDFKEFLSVFSPTIRNHKKWYEMLVFGRDQIIENRRKNEKNIRGFVGSNEEIQPDIKSKYKGFYKKSYQLRNVENSDTVGFEQYKNRILEFIKIADAYNVKVLLVTAPYISALYSEEILKFESNINKLADSLNVNYLNYNTKFKELDLRFSDFRDPGHVNIKGSNKVTSTLVNYLVNQGYFSLKNETYLQSYLNEVKERTVFDETEMSKLEEQELISSVYKNGYSSKKAHDFSRGLKATNFTFYSDDSNRYIMIEYENPLPNDFVDKINFGVQGNAYKKDYNLLPIWAKEKNVNRVTWIVKPEIMNNDGKGLIMLTLQKKCEIDNWEEFRLYYVDNNKDITGNRLDFKNVYFSKRTAETKRESLISNVIDRGKNLTIDHDFSGGLKIQKIFFYSDETQRHVALEYQEILSDDFIENTMFGLQSNSYEKDFNLLPEWVREKNINRLTWIVKPQFINSNNKKYILLTFEKRTEILSWLEFRIYYVNNNKEIIGNTLSLKDVSF